MNLYTSPVVFAGVSTMNTATLTRTRTRHLVVSLTVIHEIALLHRVNADMAALRALLLTYPEGIDTQRIYWPGETVTYELSLDPYPQTILPMNLYLLTVHTTNGHYTAKGN